MLLFVAGKLDPALPPDAALVRYYNKFSQSVHRRASASNKQDIPGRVEMRRCLRLSVTAEKLYPKSERGGFGGFVPSPV